jgi:hypothetical protein
MQSRASGLPSCSSRDVHPGLPAYAANASAPMTTAASRSRGTSATTRRRRRRRRVICRPAGASRIGTEPGSGQMLNASGRSAVPLAEAPHLGEIAAVGHIAPRAPARAGDVEKQPPALLAGALSDPLQPLTPGVSRRAAECVPLLSFRIAALSCSVSHMSEACLAAFRPRGRNQRSRSSFRVSVMHRAPQESRPGVPRGSPAEYGERPRSRPSPG